MPPDNADFRRQFQYRCLSEAMLLKSNGRFRKTTVETGLHYRALLPILFSVQQAAFSDQQEKMNTER
ncbi:MAG: hypothetical protein KAV00_18405 [Phycisphaerae bacterium]|nr:hypothetical protein [Phycisphaerae bacterium]